MYTGLSAASSGVILTSALLYSPPRRMVHWIWSPCRCYSDGHNLRAKWLQRSNKTRSKPLQCLIFRMDAVSYDWVIIQTRVQRYQCPFSDWIEVWPKWTSFYSPPGQESIGMGHCCTSSASAGVWRMSDGKASLTIPKQPAAANPQRWPGKLLHCLWSYCRCDAQQAAAVEVQIDALDR